MDSTLKQKKIRHSEYYDMMSVFDDLYLKSRANEIFNKLYNIICDENNINLAYRNIKSNSGSTTPGIDNRNIKDLEKLNAKQLTNMVQKHLNNYSPKGVKRVEIPKPNGKTRPLGIPCIIDRLIQQCILQVLEPICEAKFHERSNGFRPNRSVEHAIAQTYKMIQCQNLYYVINVDIKSFFDNVNHNKLIKQLWAMGIRDKKVLMIIKQILKAPIIMPNGDKIIPDKGTPQGGILSPLLSNVVLNELDWWITSQWEDMPTKTPYKGRIRHNVEDKSHKYRALKGTNLKEMYIVRYADDFKIFCRDKEQAEKTFIAIKQWLMDRLKLEVSDEKSYVADVRKQTIEFLGFNIKAVRKSNKYVVESHMTEKAIEKEIENLKKAIKDIEFSKHLDEKYKAIAKYNSIVWGIHNYYQIATHINKDCAKIAYRINKIMYNRLKNDLSKTGELKDGYIKERYGESKEIRYVCGYPISPIHYVQTKNPMFKHHKICKYTKEGRMLIHKNLEIDIHILNGLNKLDKGSNSIEFTDNRISLYCAQHGKCAITNQFLMLDEIHCHHKVPKELGGSDAYSNLVIVHKEIHILIHAKNINTIRKYIGQFNLDKKSINKINKLRELCNLDKITIES